MPNLEKNADLDIISLGNESEEEEAPQKFRNTFKAKPITDLNYKGKLIEN